MTRIRALIVDDEPPARRGLVLRLEKYDDVEIVGECQNGREALRAIAELEPDLIFLDIEMPGMDGFEVIRRMQPENMGLVVFVTAFDQYAVRAFDVHAVDYVLKPVDEERLRRAVERARWHLAQSGAANDKRRLMDLISNITGESAEHLDTLLASREPKANIYPDKLPIRQGNETFFVRCADITWVEAAGDYMCIHSNGKVHVLRSTLKELEVKLDPALFQRIHRSTIVNVGTIERVCSHINGEYFLILKDGTRLKMSRSYRNNIKQII